MIQKIQNIVTSMMIFFLIFSQSGLNIHLKNCFHSGRVSYYFNSDISKIEQDKSCCSDICYISEEKHCSKEHFEENHNTHDATNSECQIESNCCIYDNLIVYKSISVQLTGNDIAKSCIATVKTFYKENIETYLVEKIKFLQSKTREISPPKLFNHLVRIILKKIPDLLD